MDWQATMDAGGTNLVGGFIDSYFKARATNKVRAAQNRNAAITGARNEGILSQHRAQVAEEAVSTRMRIQRARNKARASQAVGAAFAGVTGGSVDAAAYDVARSAAERYHSVQRTAEAELGNIAEKTYQNRVNTALGQQSMVSGPSLVGLALGMTGVELQRRADETGSDGIDGTHQDTSKSGVIFNFL